MPERGRTQIKSHRQIIRLLFIQDTEHDVQEPIDSIGMQPFRTGQIRYAVERPVNDTVTVNQYDLFAH